MWANPIEAKRRLGVLPDGLALPERLSGGERLTYWGRFRGLPKKIVASRTAELLSVLELEEAEQLGALVGEYSTGMRKKIGLAKMICEMRTSDSSASAEVLLGEPAASS